MTRNRTSPLRLENAVALLLFVILGSLALTGAAPFHDANEVAQTTDGCYYNYNSYNEGDRILTNEPCLNCTCHNRMLMCYLRVCPFTKSIGQDCIVEKREDQCCPIVTCPEVPVNVSHALPTGTELSFPEKFGCSIDNKFYLEGAQVPSNPNKPCELCYCIRNRTSCVIQECTLHIDGCTPIYNRGSCCPVRYNCDHENELLEIEDQTTTESSLRQNASEYLGMTTERPSEGFVLTTTLMPSISSECIHNGQVYADGASVESEAACEHCYCMRGKIVCAVQECEMAPLSGSCRAVPQEGACCPTKYDCDDKPAESLTTVSVDDRFSEEEAGATTDHPLISEADSTTLSTSDEKDTLPVNDIHETIPEEDIRLQTHIDDIQTEKTVVESDEDMLQTTTTGISKDDSDMTTKSTLDHETQSNLAGEDMTTAIPMQEESSTEKSQHKFEDIIDNLVSKLSPTELPTDKEVESSSTLSSLEDDTSRTTTVKPDEHKEETPLSYPASHTKPIEDEAQESATKNHSVVVTTTKPEGIDRHDVDKKEHTVTSSDKKPSSEDEETKYTTVKPDVSSDDEKKDETSTAHPDSEEKPLDVKIDDSSAGDVTTVKPDESEGEDKESSSTVSPSDKEPSSEEEETKYTTVKPDVSSDEKKDETSTTHPDTEEKPLDVKIDESSAGDQGVDVTTVKPDKSEDKHDKDQDKESSSTSKPGDDENEVYATTLSSINNNEPEAVPEEGSGSAPTDDEDKQIHSTSTQKPVSESDAFEASTVETESTEQFDKEVSSTTKSPSSQTSEDDISVTTASPEGSGDESESQGHDTKEPGTESFITTTTESQSLEEDHISVIPPSKSDKESVSSTIMPDHEPSDGKEDVKVTTVEPETKTTTVFTDIEEEPKLEGVTNIPGIDNRIDFSEPSSTKPDLFPHQIPGEGECLYEGVTYSNNTVVPSPQTCVFTCMCSSSIITCDKIKCQVPIDPNSECSLAKQQTDECCPQYDCPQYIVYDNVEQQLMSKPLSHVKDDLSTESPKETEQDQTTVSLSDEKEEKVTTFKPITIVERITTVSTTGQELIEEVDTTPSTSAVSEEYTTKHPSISTVAVTTPETKDDGEEDLESEVTTLKPHGISELGVDDKSDESKESEEESTESHEIHHIVEEPIETTLKPESIAEVEKVYDTEGPVTISVTTHPSFPHHVITTISPMVSNKENKTDADNQESTPYPTTTTVKSVITPPSYTPQAPIYGQPPQYPSYPEDEYGDEEEPEVFGPGTCRYGGKLYVSAQQIPRDDPCDFCFCFRSDIICLQQSCPPPITGCHEEPINGFCCPRYECPVSMATVLNITTSTTTTSTTLPPHFLHHSYGNSAQRGGCQINGRSYSVGDAIESSSGPCISCTCGGDGKMKCDPKVCIPEPTMQQVIEVMDGITSHGR